MTTAPTAATDGLEPRPIGPGLVTLGPTEAAILSGVDTLATRLADTVGAAAFVGPPLLPVDGLRRLDYFTNFPHLGVAAGRFTQAGVDQLAAGTAPAELPTLAQTGYMLPSATCYGPLLSLSGGHLPTPVRVTAVGRCFRNEDHYDGLRRLWGFHMREVLYLGDREGAQAHLDTSRAFVERLAADLGLSLAFKPANDPFYDRDGSRARLMALDPVKHEFLAPDGTAIASVNRHRNFFGERLDIRLDGQPVHSSCTAFGLERWVHALQLAHGSAAAALAVVRDALG